MNVAEKVQKIREKLKALELFREDGEEAYLERRGRLLQELANLSSADSPTVSVETINSHNLVLGVQINENHYAILDSLAEEEQAYWEKLAHKCNSLDLARLSGDDERLTLDQLYIALRTETIEEEDEFSERDYLTALEAVTRDCFCVLLGEPGGGKSSFVRQLAGKLALARVQKTDAPLPDGWPRLRPILFDVRLIAEQFDLVALREVRDGEKREKLLFEPLQKSWQLVCQEFRVPRLEKELDKWLLEGAVVLILDGLDEVSEVAKAWVYQAVQVWQNNYPQLQRCIITCRSRSYREGVRFVGFVEHTLSLFDDEQIDQFIERWYRVRQAQGKLTEEEATAKIDELQEAAKGDDLHQLAQNPLLLTTMAIIHQQQPLPRERVRLYKRAVELLLLRWQERFELRISEEVKAFLGYPQKLLEVMQQLAYHLHCQQAQNQEAELTRGFLLEQLEKLCGKSVAFAGEFLDYVDKRAGLLVGQGGVGERTYKFPHRTFQEYLVGCHLVSGREREIATHYRKYAQQGEYWRVALEMGAEHYWYNRENPKQLLDLAYELSPVKAPRNKAEWRCVIWSGKLASIAGKEEILGDDKADGGKGYLKRLVGRLVKILEGKQWKPLERAEVGDALGILGDPRPGVGVRDGLPDLAWGTVIPAGNYTIGNKVPKLLDEALRDVIISAPYQLARYPITNAQFDCFVQARDVHDDRWWVGMPEEEKRFSEPNWSGANRPRESVSWYQAMAFCRWLSHHLKQTISLPHEYQWGVGARYAGEGRCDGRIYPWGDEQITAEHANYAETELSQTSPVGLFPRSRQPHSDLEDLGGNVWEWCANKYATPAVSDVDQSGDHRMLCGGSWGYNSFFRWAAYRVINHPYYRRHDYGFRVVRVPAPH